MMETRFTVGLTYAVVAGLLVGIALRDGVPFCAKVVLFIVGGLLGALGAMRWTEFQR